MTDPIALLPCPFCGENRAETYYVRDGRVAMCPACGAKSGSQFNGRADMSSANDRAIAARNRRAPDTARQEGIALGLAMAAHLCRETADDALDESGHCSREIALWMRGQAQSILALAPIPPHVAAARVLLDLPPNPDGLHVLPDHMRAALKQIAGGING